MSRIFFGTAILFLGLATMMWATAPICAQGAIHPSSIHPSSIPPSSIHPSSIHPSVGSVHYVAPVGPVRVGPEVRVGAVRSEHYAGAAFRGAHRNPYRDEYFRHFRPGYRSFLIGDASYYYYDNLPLGYQTVVINGITYYLYDGVYYQPYIYGGQTVYMVVPTV